MTVRTAIFQRDRERHALTEEVAAGLPDEKELARLRDEALARGLKPTKYPKGAKQQTLTSPRLQHLIHAMKGGK